VKQRWPIQLGAVVAAAALAGCQAPEHSSAEDYDCQGGSGNGPEYVDRPVRVRPPDQFGLDSDGDGLGCE